MAIAGCGTAHCKGKTVECILKHPIIAKFGIESYEKVYYCHGCNSVFLAKIQTPPCKRCGKPSHAAVHRESGRCCDRGAQGEPCNCYIFNHEFEK